MKKGREAARKLDNPGDGLRLNKMTRESAKSLRYKKTVFENGLTLLTERHPEFQSLSVGVWVKVGTRHEHPREAGSFAFSRAHAFQGDRESHARSKSRATVDQVGGDFNAFTTREYTCFHILLLARDAGLGARYSERRRAELRLSTPKSSSASAK